MNKKLYAVWLVLLTAWSFQVYAGEDVWYNAAGEVVKVTKAEVVKYETPLYGLNGGPEKQYSSALRASHGNYGHPIRRDRTVYTYPTSDYYYFPYYGRPQYRPQYRGHSRSLFDVNYRNNGWSLRFQF